MPAFDAKREARLLWTILAGRLDALERWSVVGVGRPDALLLGTRQCALDDLAPGVAYAAEERIDSLSEGGVRPSLWAVGHGSWRCKCGR
jgi:hypothetical protein